MTVNTLTLINSAIFRPRDKLNVLLMEYRLLEKAQSYTMIKVLVFLSSALALHLYGSIVRNFEYAAALLTEIVKLIIKAVYNKVNATALCRVLMQHFLFNCFTNSNRANH